MISAKFSEVSLELKASTTVKAYRQKHSGINQSTFWNEIFIHASQRCDIFQSTVTYHWYIQLYIILHWHKNKLISICHHSQFGDYRLLVIHICLPTTHNFIFWRYWVKKYNVIWIIIRLQIRMIWKLLIFVGEYSCVCRNSLGQLVHRIFWERSFFYLTNIAILVVS